MAQRKPTMVRLDADLADAVKRASARFGKSRSAIICAAIDAFVTSTTAKQRAAMKAYLIRNLGEPEGE